MNGSASCKLQMAVKPTTSTQTGAHNNYNDFGTHVYLYKSAVHQSLTSTCAGFNGSSAPAQGSKGPPALVQGLLIAHTHTPTFPKPTPRPQPLGHL